MISVLQAQALIDEHITPLPETKRCRSPKRIIAYSASRSPPAPRTCRHSTAPRWTVMPFAPMMPSKNSRSSGKFARDNASIYPWLRAMPCAFSPARACRGPGLKVIMQEDVEARDQRIRLLRRSSSFHVRKRGEDARAGEILLDPGMILDATATALLASLGQVSVTVSRRPRILHLTTGDEIVSPAQTPQPGQIRNSNASLISALCREQGVDAVTHFHAPDDLPALLQIVSEAKAETYDLILISGGSGTGSYDFSAELFGIWAPRSIFARSMCAPESRLFSAPPRPKRSSDCREMLCLISSASIFLSGALWIACSTGPHRFRPGLSWLKPCPIPAIPAKPGGPRARAYGKAASNAARCRGKARATSRGCPRPTP